MAGNAVRKAALNAREKLLEIAGKELEIDPADLEVVDGEVIAKGAPQKKISVPDVAERDPDLRRADHGDRAQLKLYAAIGDEIGQVDIPPHSAISPPLRGRGGGRRRDRRGARAQLWCVSTWPAPSIRTLVEGQIEAARSRAWDRQLENRYPYYPSVEHRGGEFGSYPAPGIENLPKVSTILIENPSADGPYGAGCSEMANNPQPPAIAAAGLRRRRRLGDGSCRSRRSVLKALPEGAARTGRSARARSWRSTKSCR